MYQSYIQELVNSTHKVTVNTMVTWDTETYSVWDKGVSILLQLTWDYKETEICNIFDL